MFDFHIEPIEEKLSSNELYDLLIIGGGPAGLNAALYAKRKGLSVAMIAKEVGGQLHNTTDVDNYLGFPLIQGSGLSKKFTEHVEKLEVPILTNAIVTSLEHDNDIFKVTIDRVDTYRSKTILLATGGSPRKLNVPGEALFTNRGVSYCTICDAPFFKGKHVVVAGGGNSAAEGVLDLIPWANRITLVHRSEFRADKIILDKLKDVKNLSIHLNTQILSVEGDVMMKGIRVLDKTSGLERFIEADGMFVEIGMIPNSQLVKDLVALNATGEVIVSADQSTSLPGLFAAGDITNQPYKQIVTSVAQGAVAALAIDKYLKLLGGTK